MSTQGSIVQASWKRAMNSVIGGVSSSQDNGGGDHDDESSVAKESLSGNALNLHSNQISSTNGRVAK